MFKSLLFAIFFMASSAHALVFIEPMVGYGTGTATFKFSDSTNSGSDEFDIKGLSYGIKGGLEIGGLQLGAEYLENKYKLDKTTGDFFEFDEKDYDIKETSALIGYKFWFARAYAGYIFNAKLDDSDFKAGKGHKFGLTFYALTHLAISLEYKSVELGDFTDEGIKFENNYKTTSLIVSFPFGI